MPRPLRLEFENAWYHVMNRGAGYKNIFKTDKHRLIFLDLLAEASTLFGIQVHAYALMDNHYHLLIKTPRANLSRAMRHINGLYTQKFNRTLKIDGPLFRGRYKAIIVDQDSYLLQVSRYIHLNPVTAKMCASPQRYKWSSCQYYYKAGKSPVWLKMTETLSMLSSKNQRNAYKNFIGEGVDKTTADFYKKEITSVILGDKLFKATLLNELDEEQMKSHKTDYNRTKELPLLKQINAVCKKYFKITEIELCVGVRGKENNYRKIGMYACRVWGAGKLVDIAKLYGISSHGGITRAVNETTRRMKADKKLRLVMLELEREIVEVG